MTPERYGRVGQLYHAALEIGPRERVQFLDEACAGDEDLRREVESLLAANEQTSGFIGAPAVEVIAKALAQDTRPSIESKQVGHYRIVSFLGAGGMGEVYLAQDDRLGRAVALKLLRNEHSIDSEKIKRFEREARAASALNHPNIVTVYDVGIADEGPFIVMELVKGRILRELLEQGPMLDSLPQLGAQMARALSVAHAAGIAHRDMKPENVMVREDGYVKVLDFGLARLLHNDPAQSESLQVSGSDAKLLGTVRYMSPEQARGGSAGTPSDVFSLGLVFYEMATGKHPFDADSPLATLHAIISKDPAPPSQWNMETSPALNDLLLSMLRKESASRPTASEVVAELERLTPQKSSRLTRLLLVIGASIVVLSLGLIGLRFGAWNRGRAPSPVRTQVTFTGDVLNAAMSPDGQFLAYVNGSSQPPKLLLQDLSGGQPVQVFQADRLFDMHWSPDGTKLLVSATLSQPFQRTFVVPRLGGEVRQLPGAPLASWSPDGTQFVGAFQNSKDLTIVEISTAATKRVPLNAKFVWMTGLDWSARGDLLLFATQDEHERNSLWTVKLDGSNPEKIHESERPILYPRWAPDGKAIYFLMGSNWTRVSSELWKVRVSSSSGRRASEPVMVVDGFHSGGSFSISRNGKRITFPNLIEQENLWLAEVDAHGEVRTRELTKGTFLYRTPSISPDGGRIVFARGDARTSNIFTMPIDGGEPKQITFFNSINASPVWSPDGTQIAFGSLEGGIPRIWSVPANGGQARVFSKSRLGNPDIAWAPNPLIAYSRSGARNFALLHPESEDETSLIKNESAGWIFAPRFSSDGRKAVIDWNRSDTGENLWLLPMDADSERSEQILTGHINFGLITQLLDGSKYRGREIKLRAMVKTDARADADRAGCYLRVQRPNRQSGLFEQNRPIRSRRWTACEIVGRVDADAERIVVGAVGTGRVWVDDLQLSVKEDSGQWQTIEITNPDFEAADTLDRPAGWRQSIGYTFRSVADSYHGRKSVFFERTPTSSGRFVPIDWTDEDSLIALEVVSRSVVVIPTTGGPAKTLFTLPWPKELAPEDPAEGYGAVSMTRDGRRFVFALRKSQSDAWVIDNFDPEVR